MIDIDDPLNKVWVNWREIRAIRWWTRRLTRNRRQSWGCEIRAPWRCNSATAFVTDDDAAEVVDVRAAKPRLVPGGTGEVGGLTGSTLRAPTPLFAGSRNLAIIDIENPKNGPRCSMRAALGDTRSVTDRRGERWCSRSYGRPNGLRVLQLSPDTVPACMGSSPRPNPQLMIATYHTSWQAVAACRAVWTRPVDGAGDQTVVFGGARRAAFHA